MVGAPVGTGDTASGGGGAIGAGFVKCERAT